LDIDRTYFFTKERGLQKVCDGSTADAAWDGTHVWLALQRGGGIRKLDSAGRMIGSLGIAEDLPPSDHGLMLHAIGPGRVVAVGCFGVDARAWCAQVDWPENGVAHVRVFHEATHMSRRAEDEHKTALDPQLAFSLHWLHAYHAGGIGADPFLLVGRFGRRQPLQINLRTFEVTVLDWELGCANFYKRNSIYSRDGLILENGQFSARLRIPASLRNSDEAEWRSIPLTNPADENRVSSFVSAYEKAGIVGGSSVYAQEKAGNVGGSGLHELVLADDGWIYIPGQWWYRIDPKTWTGQRLTSHFLPPPLRSTTWRLWNSACFGLVGLAGNCLYQIRIDELAIPTAGTPMEL